MSRAAFDEHVRAVLDGIRADGLWKDEREIPSPQSSRVELATGCFCANNYLGRHRRELRLHPHSR